MKKQIIIAGILGCVVMFIWVVFSLAVLRLGTKPAPRALPDQAELHAALKKRIVDVGVYACLYASSEKEANQFPNYRDEPLYEITYSGYTHNTVPGFRSFGVLAFLFAPVVAACLLSKASDSVLTRYPRRVLFVAGLGLFLAMGGDWMRALSGGQPNTQLLLATLNSLITWILVGLVIAWQVKPLPKLSEFTDRESPAAARS